MPAFEASASINARIEGGKPQLPGEPFKIMGVAMPFLPDADSISSIIKRKRESQELPQLVRIAVKYELYPYLACETPYDVCSYDVTVSIVDWQGNIIAIGHHRGECGSYDPDNHVALGYINGDVDVTGHYRLMPLGLFPVIVSGSLVCREQTYVPPTAGLTGTVTVYGSWGW